MSTTRTGSLEGARGEALVLVEGHVAAKPHQRRIGCPQHRQRRDDGKADDDADLLGAGHDQAIRPRDPTSLP